MTGFFKGKKKAKPKKKKAKKTTQESFLDLFDQEANCQKCKLADKCESPRIPVQGKGRLGILIIGEQPTHRDDNQGAFWTGKSGDIIEDHLMAYDVDLEEDCWTTMAVICKPPKAATKTQAKYCAPNLLKTIQKLKPRLIITLGTLPLESLIGTRWKKGLGGTTMWRGFVIPDQHFKCWVAPTYSPQDILKAKKGSVIATVFQRDIERALARLDDPVPDNSIEKDKECVQLLTTRESIKYLKWLNQRQPDRIAFDYETTGLKPQAEGHRIITVSIAHSEKAVVAFSLNKGNEDPLCDVLENPRIKKIAANFKMEETWSRWILGIEVANWEWDTMLANHVVDNRQGMGFNGLKFLTAVYFGIMDYDSEIGDFLKSPGKNDNAFNRILEAPREKLLTYNALDSLYTFRLALIQMGILR